MRGEVDPLSILRLARLARRLRPDLLHAHTPRAHTLALLACRLAGRPPVVVTRRVDFSIRRHPGPFKGWKYGPAVARIVAISEAIRRVLVADGVDPGRIAVVPSGIDPARLEAASPGDLRASFGIPPGAPVVGTIAHFADHKDHATLVAAIPAVRRAVPAAVFLLVGDGDLRPSIEAQARSLGVSEAVRFAGFRSDVPAILALLDVLAVPSKEEGLGTGILDALAMGKPVAATSAGGIPEIIEGGVHGLLSPPRDPAALAANVAALLADPARARALGEAGRARVLERFTADRMVEGNLAVYRAVLG